MKVYSGYYKDADKCLCSSSGGATTAIAEKIICQGGYVFGVAYSEDFYSAEYVCVDRANQLKIIKGSKYIKSNKRDIYKIIEEKLATGKPVLFIGLGCDVAGVKSFVKKRGIDQSNLFTIDILCHGPAVAGVHESYIKRLEKKYRSKVSDFTIRYKKNGWTPFYIRAIFQNGKEYVTPFIKTDYGKAFYAVAEPQCLKCPFKGVNHRGDLCCGDFWGLTQVMPGWNDKGVSIMIVQTDKGNKLLELLDDDFELMNADYDFVVKHNPMYVESRKQNADYDKFIRDMKGHGLHYAVSKLPKTRIKVKIKNILSRFLVADKHRRFI